LGKFDQFKFLWYNEIKDKKEENIMGLFILIAWLVVGAYFLVQNSDAIAEVTDERRKLVGMIIITFSSPFYMIVEMFDYMLEQIFGEEWKDENDSGKPC
jgi:hypothetical protein